jgi:uncharacterized protein RhaS with RHS repeats
VIVGFARSLSADNYNYFRDYDPATGRYMQSDPIGLAGGLNTYGYAGGNPTNFVDPFGLLETTLEAFCARNPAQCLAVLIGTGAGLSPTTLSDSEVDARHRRPMCGSSGTNPSKSGRTEAAARRNASRQIRPLFVRPR